MYSTEELETMNKLEAAFADARAIVDADMRQFLEAIGCDRYSSLDWSGIYAHLSHFDTNLDMESQAVPPICNAPWHDWSDYVRWWDIYEEAFPRLSTWAALRDFAAANYVVYPLFGNSTTRAISSNGAWALMWRAISELAQDYDALFAAISDAYDSALDSIWEAISSELEA